MAKSRIKMKLRLQEQDFEKVFQCRTVSQNDTPSLGALMLASFYNTIDYEGETLEDAVQEVRETLNGKYGPFLENCSFLIEEKGLPLSAVLTVYSLEMGIPLIAYTITDPDYANQGMATFLLKKSVTALLASGYKEVFLVVTEGNASAYHVYEKLGFLPFE